MKDRLTRDRKDLSRAVDIESPLRFGRTQRLRRKAEFDAVYRDGRRSTDALFAVIARPNVLGVPRLGLSIGAKAVGNAVSRNRVKRLVRESFRLHQQELAAADFVVNARAGARSEQNAAVSKSLERHWRNLTKQCAPSSSP